MTNLKEPGAISAAVQRWVETFVVGMNLCPFANRELKQERVRFIVTQATSEPELLASLRAELELLEADSAIETTLLIHPRLLRDFEDYNQFLGKADDLLRTLGVEGVYQVASFHPDYQFADTSADDAENYTNRSPYPLLHLLREQSLDRAIAGYPDTAQIPLRNIKRMKELGNARLRQLLLSCFEDVGKT